ncbi:MAG: AraC family transcriptional regulator [Bacteroidota bacterium]|nr:AraC family transcriptional regulator [Kiloniellaceae bacterium]
MTDANGELIRLIEQNHREDGVVATPIPRLHLIRFSRPTERIHGLSEPALCIAAQGRKRAMVGDRIFEYDRSRFLVISVDVPVAGQIIEATPREPYLCFRLDLDRTLLASLFMELGDGFRHDRAPEQGVVLSPVTPELLDASLRLLRLLQTPEDAAMLAPLVEREILYRLVCSEQGARLWQIAHGESRLQQVNRAIRRLQRDFEQPIAIAELAAEAGMSVSAFHQHFKTVTAMSPLQYQKQLRLQEARRLILSAAMDAASAGHRVGYDSASQFSREYSRLFGAPPMRDAQRLRAQAPEPVAV